MIKSLTKNLEETVAAEDEIFESASDNDLLDAQISSSSSSDTESSDTESSEWNSANEIASLSHQLKLKL